MAAYRQREILSPNQRFLQLQEASDEYLRQLSHDLPVRQLIGIAMTALRQACVYDDENELEAAYLYYSRFISIWIRFVLRHADFKSLSAEDQSVAKHRAADVLTLSERIKDELYAAYADFGVEERGLAASFRARGYELASAGTGSGSYSQNRGAMISDVRYPDAFLRDSTTAERDDRTVICKPIAATVRSRDLEDFFSSIGTVRGVRIVTDSESLLFDRVDRVGHVVFYEREAVKRAISLSGKRLQGIPLIIQEATNCAAIPATRPVTLRLDSFDSSLTEGYIRSGLVFGQCNLDIARLLRASRGKGREFTKQPQFFFLEIAAKSLQTLRGIFEPFGKVDNVEIVKDEIGQSRGYGFITFRNGGDAKLAMDDTTISGLGIKVAYDPKDQPEHKVSLVSEDLDRGGLNLGAAERSPKKADLSGGADVVLPEMAQLVLDMSQQQGVVTSPPVLHDAVMAAVEENQPSLLLNNATTQNQTVKLSQPIVPERGRGIINPKFLPSNMFDPSRESFRERPSSSAAGAAFGFAVRRPGHGWRTVRIPHELTEKFLEMADSNTKINLETCGLLCGKLAGNKLHITHLVIPKQSSTAFSCKIDDDEVSKVLDDFNLIILGWIHTHPLHKAHMSSVDLHVSYGYQMALPEAIAIVCSPKFEETKVFMLTPREGMERMRLCAIKGLHAHVDADRLFMTCCHIQWVDETHCEVIDIREP